MMPMLVAHHSGISHERLESSPVVFRSGVELLQSVIGGGAQIGVCSAPEGSVFGMMNQGMSF
jgi:hypothetical protein